MESKDIQGQAQTGSDKACAFALPLLNAIDHKLNAPANSGIGEAAQEAEASKCQSF